MTECRKVTIGDRLTSVTSMLLVFFPTEVLDALKQKHPAGADINPGTILHGPVDRPTIAASYNLTGELIRKTALRCSGGAGPSGVDSVNARHILCSRSFTGTNDLCTELSSLGQSMMRSNIDPNALAPLLASRAIALCDIRTEWPKCSLCRIQDFSSEPSGLAI